MLAKPSWWPRMENPGRGWCPWNPIGPAASRECCVDSCSFPTPPTPRSCSPLCPPRSSTATVFVSAASGWEIATRARLGRLPGAEGLLQDLPSLLQQQGFQSLAIQVHHGVRAGGYRQSHRDPFDRLLAAQAELEGLQLVSVRS